MKKIIAIFGVLLIAIAVAFICISIRAGKELSKYADKNTLYERLNFVIPEDIQVEELHYNINEKTMKGEQNERLDLALSMDDDEINKFIEMIEKSGYQICDWIDAEEAALLKPSSVDKNDIEELDLKALYEYCFTRKAGDWNVRCKIHVYIYEVQEERYNVYISYAG